MGIETKLGEELIRRLRDGTLNGQGGKLVRDAERQKCLEEEAYEVKRLIDRMKTATHLELAEDLPRRFLDMASTVKVARLFCDGDGI